MTAKHYDPLAWVPTPDVVQKKLAEAKALAERLAILLEVSERMHSTATDRREAAGEVVRG
jgi:hypothetical protein